MTGAELFARDGIALIFDSVESRTFAASPGKAITAFTVERMISAGGSDLLVAVDPYFGEELAIQDGISVDDPGTAWSPSRHGDPAGTIREIAARRKSGFELVSPGMITIRFAHRWSGAAAAAVALSLAARKGPLAVLCEALTADGEALDLDGALALSRREWFPLIHAAEMVGAT